mgnify:FL=1
MKAIVGKLIFKPPFEKYNGEEMNYEIGDLIYAPKWGEYAVYLGKGSWIGWIHIFRIETGSKDQVHDFVWEKA